MSETKIEQDMRLYVKSIGGRFPKWTSPGSRGVQDRILLLPGCPVAFVEVKTETGVLRLAQRRWRSWMLRNGHRARVARSVDELKEIIIELLEERDGHA